MIACFEAVVSAEESTFGWCKLASKMPEFCFGRS